MTIGIAASGPRAGLAVYRALQAVERVATGSVGGYAAFAALVENSGVLRAETQRGGTRTLFVDGEKTGVAPPPEIAGAHVAGVMSSGPDRPSPLSQYVPAEFGAGLVTGHRLPNAEGATGRAINLEVLDRLRAGMSAQQAVDAVLDADPEADAGLIAVDRDGAVYGRNSRRVERRPDLGFARSESAAAAIVVLHNAISPPASVAALAADIGLATMVPPPAPEAEILVRAGTPLVAGDGHRVHVDADGIALRIETRDQRILSGTHNCAAIYLGSTVIRDACEIGCTLFEPNVVVADGRIATLNGRDSMRIGYRRVSRR